MGGVTGGSGAGPESEYAIALARTLPEPLAECAVRAATGGGGTPGAVIVFEPGSAAVVFEVARGAGTAADDGAACGAGGSGAGDGGAAGSGAGGCGAAGSGAGDSGAGFGALATAGAGATPGAVVVVGFAVGAPYGAVLGAFFMAPLADAVFEVPADFDVAVDFGSAPLCSDFAAVGLVAAGSLFAGGSLFAVALVAAGFCAPDPSGESRTAVGSLVIARGAVAGFAAPAGAAATGAVGTSVADLADGIPVAGVLGAPGTGVGSFFVRGFVAGFDAVLGAALGAALDAALLGLATVFGRAAGAALAAGAGFGVASLRTGVGEGSGWRTTVFALVAPADAPARVVVRGCAAGAGASVDCFTRSASFSSEATGVCWSCSHSATSIASSSTTEEASSSGDFFVTSSPP